MERAHRRHRVEARAHRRDARRPRRRGARRRATHRRGGARSRTSGACSARSAWRPSRPPPPRGRMSRWRRAFRYTSYADHQPRRRQQHAAAARLIAGSRTRSSRAPRPSGVGGLAGWTYRGSGWSSQSSSSSSSTPSAGRRPARRRRRTTTRRRRRGVAGAASCDVDAEVEAAAGPSSVRARFGAGAAASTGGRRRRRRPGAAASRRTARRPGSSLRSWRIAPRSTRPLGVDVDARHAAAARALEASPPPAGGSRATRRAACHCHRGPRSAEAPCPRASSCRARRPRRRHEVVYCAGRVDRQPLVVPTRPHERRVAAARAASMTPPSPSGAAPSVGAGPRARADCEGAAGRRPTPEALGDRARGGRQGRRAARAVRAAAGAPARAQGGRLSARREERVARARGSSCARPSPMRRASCGRWAENADGPTRSRAATSRLGGGGRRRRRQGERSRRREALLPQHVPAGEADALRLAGDRQRPHQRAVRRGARMPLHAVGVSRQSYSPPLRCRCASSTCRSTTGRCTSTDASAPRCARERGRRRPRIGLVRRATMQSYTAYHYHTWNHDPRTQSRRTASRQGGLGSSSASAAGP